MPHIVAPAVDAGTIRGTTTTQARSVLLPGVEVRVFDAATAREVSVVVSDGDGRFRADGLAAGRYRVVAHLPAFTDAATDVELAAGQDLDVALDLKLAPFWERVNVVGQTEAARLATGSSPVVVKGSMMDVLPIVPGSFQAALPVLPGVVRTPDGQISVKGARPTQGGLQVGQGNAIDPSTGAFGVELPSDAIESVEVIGNPYGTRDGGFSSSMVKVETRAGNNEWHASARGLIPFPCLKMCDGVSMGIRRYEPRVWFGGPLRKDRLFLAQGIEYRWNRFRVPSLPEDANDFTNQGLNVFTRLDANLASGHALAATIGFFSRQDDRVNLNTFNLNAGIDVMHASYMGESLSRPVVIRRADLTVSERLEFGSATTQRVGGTTIAIYVQDRWRLSDRVLLEPGFRLDRDGVLHQTGLSPRTGVVLRVAKGDSSVVRGGVGVFRQRTPLNVGAFESFEPATVTRFALDGLTPIPPPVTFVHRTSPLEMPRSLIWNVEYDQRVGSSLFLKVNHLQRRGSGEAIVEPVQTGQAAELRLDSEGRHDTWRPRSPSGTEPPRSGG